MRVFLYCIDALEYDFLDSGDFEALKQTQYHKVEIPEKCMTILDDGSLKPFTPVIWKAILTGESEEDTASVKPQRYENSLVNWLHRRKTARKYGEKPSTGACSAEAYRSSSALVERTYSQASTPS